MPSSLLIILDEGGNDRSNGSPVYVFSRLRKVAATEDLPIHCRHQSVWLASHSGPLASTQLSLGAPAVHAANGRLTPNSHSFIIRSLLSNSGSLVKLARTSCPSPGTRLSPKSSPLVGRPLRHRQLLGRLGPPQSHTAPGTILRWSRTRGTALGRHLVECASAT